MLNKLAKIFFECEANTVMFQFIVALFSAFAFIGVVWTAGQVLHALFPSLFPIN